MRQVLCSTRPSGQEVREGQLRNHSAYQWEVDIRLSTWDIGDFRERHITKLRDTGPLWKELLEEEVGWHWTDDLPLDVASETLSLVAGFVR